MGLGGGGRRGEMGTERDLDRGKGCMMQCADDVLMSCTLETYMGLQTNVTPINSIKNVFHFHYISIFPSWIHFFPLDEHHIVFLLMISVFFSENLHSTPILEEPVLMSGLCVGIVTSQH